MRITLNKEPEPTPEDEQERLFTPPEDRETPWRCGIWDGKLTVAFGYAEYGWILMAILTTAFNRGTVIHCSDAYDPFPDMQKWLEQIARGELPADWSINEEGYISLLRAKPEEEDKLDLQIWGYPYPEDPKYPPKLILRARIEREQLLTEFYRRFTRYVQEDFDPRHWIMCPEEDQEARAKIPDLRNVDLSRIKEEIDRLACQRMASANTKGEMSPQHLDKTDKSPCGPPAPKHPPRAAPPLDSRAEDDREHSLDDWKSTAKQLLTEQELDDPLARKLSDAASRKQSLHIVYHGGSTPGRRRAVIPTALFRVQGYEGLYLDAVDVERNEPRCYRLDLVEDAPEAGCVQSNRAGSAQEFNAARRKRRPYMGSSENRDWENDPAWVDIIGNTPDENDKREAVRQRPEAARRAEEYLRKTYGADWRAHSPYPEHREGRDSEPSA